MSAINGDNLHDCILNETHMIVRNRVII